MSPALAGRFFTTELPEKTLLLSKMCTMDMDCSGLPLWMALTNVTPY